MTRSTQIRLIKDMDNANIEIIKKKQLDYADIDVLSNFKRLSTVVKTLNLNLNNPVSYALFMSLLKIDRINNLLSSEKEPSNESIEDSFIDLLGYAKLAYLCFVENKEEPVPEINPLDINILSDLKSEENTKIAGKKNFEQYCDKNPMIVAANRNDDLINETSKNENSI